MPTETSQVNIPSASPDPVTYMRARHPDLFSDSVATEAVELTQGLLEYHLETITNRSQENEFAYFARRLAEKEICPNLRPQTGPTGGGDSKADSETIPVSSEVSELWVGIDPKAGTERWAFAFSAKKDWKSKVASDVRNIASTDRGYTRIYFITNQFAPDKSRSESEDSLSKESGMTLTILDRSWITKVVLENGRAEIAVEALNIHELRSLTSKTLGPADLERQQELQELENRISDPGFYRGARYQLVEDSLRAALLARGLGRPRTDIDGLFIRADRLASDPENARQRLRVSYNYAWTLIFWFDDYRQLNSLYDIVASFALGSDQMEEVELALNLWMVLLSQVRRGVLSMEEAKIGPRKEAISAVLKTLSADEVRPNNALQARTSLALLSIQEATEGGDGAALDEAWVALSQIVTDAENLGDYPFERLANLVEELGELGADSQEFDALFEAVVSKLEKRRGEAAGANLLRDRGFQKLEADKPYEAIGLLGRAMERFAKREHREDLIFCLMVLSDAYTKAGLLWAARSCALSSVERCLAYYREGGRLRRFSLSALEQLITIELRLGRVAHVLMAFELKSILASQLAITEDQRKSFDQQRQLTEGMLGIALLSSSLPQLRQMEGLPEALEALGLFIPKGLLLYALGHRDELRNEGFPADKWSDAEIDDFVKLAFSQPGRLQMPVRPQIESGQKVIYSTSVLGCRIEIEAPATVVSISVAEAVLSSIEAFFATSLDQRIMPYRSAARIIVEPAPDLTEGIGTTSENIDGDAFIRVRHPEAVPTSSAAARQSYRDGLMTLITNFMMHVAVVPDVEAYMDKIAGDERGFARALLYSEVSLAQDNVFGSEPKVLVSDWAPPGKSTLKLGRPVEWYHGLEIEQIPLPNDGEEVPFDPVDPEGSFKMRADRERHSDRKIASLIDIPLWDSAGWCSVFYMFDPDGPRLPILGLGFKNGDAAVKIFKGWRKTLGDDDQNNQLRVTVLKGVDRSNPMAYRVYIGININPAVTTSSLVMMVGRHQTLTPASLNNLERFLERLAQTKQYLLMPARFENESEPPHLAPDLAILKTQLVVKNAWEVSLNDVDATAITPNDDPVIPSDVKDAPVTHLINAMREMMRRHRE